MPSELLKELVEAGVHFGHQSKKWHPNMKPFLLQIKNGVHIINLEETEKQLGVAAEFLTGIAREGKKILFVGCKRQAQDPVREAAEKTGEAISEASKEAAAKASEAASGAMDATKQAAGEAMDATKQAAGEAVDKAKEVAADAVPAK